MATASAFLLQFLQTRHQAVDSLSLCRRRMGCTAIGPRQRVGELTHIKLIVLPPETVYRTRFNRSGDMGEWSETR